MAVNNMTIEQAYQVVADLAEQATGETVLTPTDLSSYITVGQKALSNGYDPLLNAISQVLQRTLIAVRPYERKFKSLAVTNDRFGAITRKLNFGDGDIQENVSYELEEGVSYSPWTVKKPVILQTNFVGSDTWEMEMTVFTRQLDVAMKDPAELARLMTGLMTHFSNQREQKAEQLARATVTNFIAGENIIGNVVHLLTEYKQETGLNDLTVTTVKQPQNFPAFVRWAYARIGEVSSLMTERSQMYQQVITGYKIMRHTPVNYQRIYLNDNFLKHITAEVKSITYNDNYLETADHEGVNFWQAIESPMAINVKPVYIDNTAEIVTAEQAQEMDNVIGVIMDRDACAYNIYQDTLEASPYNPKSESYNLIHKTRTQYSNDFTEKGVVFLLD